MAVSYAYGGFDPASAHQNVRKAWDKLLHEQVVDKSAFKGLVGKDKGGEGSLDSETVNAPIVEKTQLGKESGDQITVGLVTSNITNATWYNDGKSGNNQLVDSEQSLTLYNTKVKIAHQRFGVAIDGKMTLQRTPYDLVNTAKNNLSQEMSNFQDSGVFFSLYSGYSPNVLRELGTTAADPTDHPNRIFGKGKAALTDVSTTDVLDTDALDIIRVFWETRNINPIRVDGEPHACLYVHPFNGRTLRRDSLWQDANINGMERGKSNPVFQNSLGAWAGIVVKESNKVGTAKDYNGLTVASDEITLSDATMGAGITATDVYMSVLLGANAVARAFALESYMVRRKEDDYENIYGFGGGYIYGDRRADFALSQDSGSDGSVKNQSSAVIYFHKGDATALTLPSIW